MRASFHQTVAENSVSRQILPWSTTDPPRLFKPLRSLSLDSFNYDLETPIKIWRVYHTFQNLAKICYGLSVRMPFPTSYFYTFFSFTNIIFKLFFHDEITKYYIFFISILGTPINRLPIMAKQVLDLFELYNLVVARGGLVEVINKKLWQEVIKGLGLPSSITSAAFTLRTQWVFN